MTFALRPYLQADRPTLARLFRDSIEGLTEEDYDTDQREAWAALADEPGFATGLDSDLVLLAVEAKEILGFASLRAKGSLQMLYIAPTAARRGIGTALCDALERLAGARGTAKIEIDASDTAEPFFKHRGYVGTRRNTVRLGDVWLGNTTMEKTLALGTAR